eukprot:CAMPEP_0201576564 /NCGR_PEP_ID=MMETSP0190_2-20130828/22446_1 /ASSEMBLY_ACC=CAM_ASM_000263 /TAXON_ID=37353 /ORGANISM="Rosalina sp." /LENGTH=348 /DNA_ID=CAMNT_0048007553 /DNA_START=189 /DNA_END=1235 /DNA_ORIENTATION=+
MVQKDKKLVKHLQREYSNEKMVQNLANSNRNVDPQQLDNSIQKLVQVPVGNLHEFSTVRLISYFISTLNSTYTDFDFTSCEPNQFQMEKPQTVNETINARLTPLTKSKPLLMDSFWKSINSSMDLQQCEFYSFTPSDDVMQVLRPHSLWNIDYFIVNLKKKQLLYLSLYAQNNLFEKKLSLDGLDEFKHDLDMDIDQMAMDVNDGMAWCQESSMSPHSSPNKKQSNDNTNKPNKNSNSHNNNNNLDSSMNNNHRNNRNNDNLHRNHSQNNSNQNMNNNHRNLHRNNHNHVNNMNMNNNNVNQQRMNNNGSSMNNNNYNYSANHPLQVQVMSIDNCLDTMPHLERPEDL